MSLEEIFTVLSDINPNTLDPLELRLNVQTLLRLDFLAKGDKRSEVADYLKRINSYITEKVILEEAALKTIGFERTSPEDQARETLLRRNLVKVLRDHLEKQYGKCEVFNLEHSRDESAPITHPIIYTDFQDETFSTMDYLVLLPGSECRIAFVVTSGDLLLPHNKEVLHGQAEAELHASAFGNNTHMIIFSRDLQLADLEQAIPKIFPAVKEYELAASETSKIKGPTQRFKRVSRKSRKSGSQSKQPEH